MAEQELEQVLSEVAQALDGVNRAFEHHLETLKQGGAGPDRVRQADEAVRALKDSAAMYLAWARHYAGLPETDESPIS